MGLVGLFVYAQLARSSEPLGLDQGLFACFGRWVREGWLPYRDMFDSKPPLHLYTWVLAWLGGTPASAWWFEAVWLAGTLGLAFAVARRWWNAWAGLAASAFMFVAIWSPGFGGYWSRLQAEELLALPELAAVWFAIVALAKPRAAFACGLLMGAVGLYKIPALALGVACPTLWVARLGHRDAIGRVGWFAAGLVVPWLVASSWFAAHGAFGTFVDSIFVYQRYWMAQIDPPLRGVIEEFASIAARDLPALWLAAIAGIALGWRRDRARAVCLLAWIVAASLAIVLQRQLAGYHFLLLAPPLAIAATSGVVESVDRARVGATSTRIAAAAALCIVAALLVAGLRRWIDAYGADDMRSYTRNQFSPADEVEVARYVAARTEPHDGILVWALAPGIYALADRQPVTRYPFHRLLLTDAPLARAVPGRDARRAALLARLRTDPPAYVVVGTNDANSFEPQDSVMSLFAFGELSQLVQRGYREETRIGRFVVLARVK